MTICNLKGDACSDKSTENYHHSSSQLYGDFLAHGEEFRTRGINMLGLMLLCVCWNAKICKCICHNYVVICQKLRFKLVLQL